MRVQAQAGVQRSQRKRQDPDDRPVARVPLFQLGVIEAEILRRNISARAADGGGTGVLFPPGEKAPPSKDAPRPPTKAEQKMTSGPFGIPRAVFRKLPKKVQRYILVIWDRLPPQTQKKLRDLANKAAKELWRDTKFYAKCVALGICDIPGTTEDEPVLFPSPTETPLPPRPQVPRPIPAPGPVPTWPGRETVPGWPGPPFPLPGTTRVPQRTRAPQTAPRTAPAPTPRPAPATRPGGPVANPAPPVPRPAPPLPGPPIGLPVPPPAPRFGLRELALLAEALSRGRAREPARAPAPNLVPREQLVPQPPLTLSQSRVRECECPEPKKRKPREPRSVCYSGTFTETRRGTRKRRKRKVPCK